MIPQTSFRLLHEAGACKERYKYLAKHLGGIKRYGRDTPITLLQIFDICGLDDALWALHTCPGHHSFKCMLSVDFAEHVLPIAEIFFRDNGEIRNCLRVIRDHVALGVSSFDTATLSNTLKFIHDIAKKRPFTDRNSIIIQEITVGACKALYAAEVAIEKAIAIYNIRNIIRYKENTILIEESDRLVALAAQEAAGKIGLREEERRWQVVHLSKLINLALLKGGGGN